MLSTRWSLSDFQTSALYYAPPLDYYQQQEEQNVFLKKLSSRAPQTKNFPDFALSDQA